MLELTLNKNNPETMTFYMHWKQLIQGYQPLNKESTFKTFNGMTEKSLNTRLAKLNINTVTLIY